MIGNLMNSLIPKPPRAATVQQLGHPRAGIIGMWGVGESSSGQHVTEDTALTFAAFWCGVRVISELVASLPCILYRKNGNESKERATDDRRYSLVHDSPNDELDAYHFFEIGTAHQVVWGNSYAPINRNGMNEIMELDVWLPDRTDVKRRADNVLMYECSEPRDTVEFQDMLHGVGFSYDGIKGYSLIRYAAESLGVCVAGDKYVGAALKNGGVPSGVLDTPIKLAKPAREELRREWDEIHTGPNKAGRLAITHGGIKYMPISMNNKDAELIELRKFNVVEIARWLRLPLYILNDLENSGVRANIEQQSLDLIAYSLMPWVKRWEGALRMKLLNREERKTMYFEFLLDSLLRGDTLTRYQAYALGRQWGWESINDIRKKENRNGIGPAGDDYLQPMNMQPAGTQQPDLPNTIRTEYEKTVQDTIRETVGIAKQMKSSIKAGFCKVDEAFKQFGGVLDQSLSSERETFRMIKDDIEQLGAKVAVRVPEMPQEPRQSEANHDVLKAGLAYNLEVVLKREGAEALKAAKAQMRDRTQNFIHRVDAFYEEHSAFVKRLFWPIALYSPNLEQLVSDHVAQSKAELLACADGNPDEFEARVQACVERWLSERITKEAEDCHAKIF